MRDMVGGCNVCSDDRGWNENPLVYCDGVSCTVAVHQACYGIVTVPTGNWYCRKCESQEKNVSCELCPSKYGALKPTESSDKSAKPGWAHVVCALYIPEVRFGNVTTMEPIQLQLIPAERFNKVCYICEEEGNTANAQVGACMQCNRAGCKQQFHVTCAQALGLLCEEAGNYFDNVKYCGYCQHHYSKLKKGGNVKPIPPFKPLTVEGSAPPPLEKEPESGPSKPSTSPASGKRRSGSSSKSTSKTSNPSNKSTSSQYKAVHNNSKSSEKPKVTNSSSRSSKSEDASADSATDVKIEKREQKTEPADSDATGKTDTKDSKFSKKRKANSRTPTPISGVTSDASVPTTVIPTVPPSNPTATTTSADKKNTAIISETISEKPKKPKVDTTQSIIINQPVVALTSISTIKSTSSTTTIAETVSSEAPIVSAHPTPPTIIQTAQTQSVNSLLVSVPLASTSLSPHHPLINNQTTVLTPTPQERSASTGSAERNTPVAAITPTGSSSNTSSNMLTSEMSGGGLKITYEKQDINMEVDMELEVPPSPVDDPAKRDRSQSHEKSERSSRSKKRLGGTNGVNNQISTSSSLPTKRSSRSQNSSSPTPGAFSSISQSQMTIKDSPPSSPSSESRDATSSHSRGRAKGRKSAPASVNSSSSSKDTKDVKLFQNGIMAPHMLGNQLNPNSNMAQKMTDHLNSELEAHSIFNANENAANLVGPQLHHRVVASARASSTGGSSTASGGSGLSSMLGGGGGSIPQTLDQLLERQWEQGSQFLMEQAQHFDIASLLSCLHQLRAENLRLEEHVSSLLQRRDHLLAVNARLAIPLTGQPATPQSSHPHTVNNIHPAVAPSHSELSRPSRHSGGGLGYPPHPQGGSQHPSGGPVENGLPPEQYVHSHRSPAGSQPSPTVRHSPAGPAFSNSGMLRQSDNGGRSAPRPQPYPLYQGPGPSQQQMVMRRDAEMHHQNSSKPS